MAIFHLLGYKHLDFNNDKGEEIKGTQIYGSFPEDGVTGAMVGKYFLRDDFDLPELTPGMTLEVTYNRKGKPEKVTEAPAAQRLNLSKS